MSLQEPTTRIERARLEALAREYGETNCCYDDGEWHIGDLDGFTEALLEEPNALKSRIAGGFYQALQLLGGMSDVLAIAGSYGDTMTDEDTADMIEEWVANEKASRAEGSAT